MKLFEIPIYAFTKEQLKTRVDYRKGQFHYHPYNHVKKTVSKNVVYDTYPQELYDYNHVVGMIVIHMDKYEVEAKLYKAVYEKYYWKSSKKKFLMDMQINGAHVPYDKKNADSIKDSIRTVYNIATSCIEKDLFIDNECFENVIEYIDFSKFVDKD